jgi:hypothetical protein
MVLYPHPDKILPMQSSKIDTDNRRALVVMVPLHLPVCDAGVRLSEFTFPAAD